MRGPHINMLFFCPTQWGEVYNETLAFKSRRDTIEHKQSYSDPPPFYKVQHRTAGALKVGIKLHLLDFCRCFYWSPYNIHFIFFSTCWLSGLSKRIQMQTFVWHHNSRTSFFPLEVVCTVLTWFCCNRRCSPKSAYSAKAWWALRTSFLKLIARLPGNLLNHPSNSCLEDVWHVHQTISNWGSAWLLAVHPEIKKSRTWRKSCRFLSRTRRDS